MDVPDEVLEMSRAGCSNDLGDTEAPPWWMAIEIAISVTGDMKSSVSTDMLLLGLNNCALMYFEVCHGDL